MPISYDPSQLMPGKPPGLPRAWHAAAEQIAATSRSDYGGYVPFETTEHNYVAKVVAAVERLRPDAATLLLLAQPQIFQETMNLALAALQSRKQADRRTKGGTFLGWPSDLPSPPRLAGEMVGMAKRNHRKNMVSEVVNQSAGTLGVLTTEIDDLVKVIIGDFEHGDVPGNELYLKQVLERLRSANKWGAEAQNLSDYYPPGDERAWKMFNRRKAVSPYGSSPTDPPAKDPVARAIQIAEDKLEDVAFEARQLIEPPSDYCPEVNRPLVEDEVIDERICAATNAIQILLLGERGLIFDAAEEARRQFENGTLVVRDEALQRDLYFGARRSYQMSVDVVPADRRQQIYSDLGFATDLRGNIASYRAFVDLVNDLNAYSAALCQGPECGRTAWARVRISIRRVRSQIAMVVSEHTVLEAAAMVRQYNAEAELLGRLSANVFSGAVSSAGFDVLPAVRAMRPDQARDQDLATLTALAEAWQRIMELVGAGEDVDPNTHIVADAQDAAALIR